MISTQATEYGRPDGSVSPLLRHTHDRLSTALDRIGSQRRFKRNTEIYSEGETANCWFKVMSGAVRTTKIFEDGRRHIGQFYFEEDFFGFDKSDERIFSAEAVCDSMSCGTRGMEASGCSTTIRKWDASSSECC